MAKRPTIRTDAGLTVAILSSLQILAKKPVTCTELVGIISNAGRKTTVQEVSSIMVSILKSQVKALLEIDSIGRAKTYLLKEEYRNATVDQLQKVYLKRVRYSAEDLYQDLHGVSPKSTPQSTHNRSAGRDTGEILVKGKGITLVLEEPFVEITVKYRKQ